MTNRVLVITCQCGNRFRKVLERDAFVPGAYHCSRCGCGATQDIQKESDAIGVLKSEVQEEPSCERCKMKDACSLRFNTKSIRSREGSILSYKVEYCNEFADGE